MTMGTSNPSVMISNEFKSTHTSPILSHNFAPNQARKKIKCGLEHVESSGSPLEGYLGQSPQ